jgi:DNA-binding XRE family transcriptional regulator
LYFSQNIKHLRALNKYTQDELAAHLGVGRTSITNYEKGNSKPSFDDLLALSKLFNVNLNDIVFADLTKSKVFQPMVDVRPLPIVVNSDGNERIVLIDVKAAAGYPVMFQDTRFIERLPTFTIPIPEFSSGTFRCFEVSGDSMWPTIFNNDLVVAEYTTFATLKIKDVYVVVTSDGVLIKRVKALSIDQCEVELSSDNNDYSSFVLKHSEIKEVWKVRKRITSVMDEPKDNTPSTVADLIARMEKMEIRLTKLENNEKSNS